MIRLPLLFLVLLLQIKSLFAQEHKIYSPNKSIELLLQSNYNKPGAWFLQVKYRNNSSYVVVVPAIQLGLRTTVSDFTNTLKLEKIEKTTTVDEQYTTVHGKKSHPSNMATEGVFRFINNTGQKVSLVLRAYNDGIAFRYELSGKTGEKVQVTEELTSYEIKPDSERWLHKFVPSYEGFYSLQDKLIEKGQWGYPGLFKAQAGNDACWMLISEAGMDGNYCATKLENKDDANIYRLVFPTATENNSLGDVNPTVSLPWESPWRVIMIGKKADIVQSTLIEDVSPKSKIKDVSWVKPGKSSWIYWAYNHGTMDYQKLVEYIDLAARMNWPYTLFDWEWDQMGNGGKLEDAVKYANSKGIKPLMWYNSGGPNNNVTSTPRDRMFTHESRMKEFAWLKSIGVYGVKIDFFESDKQNTMRYYIDILEDAASNKMMVNFHGSTVPRGWSRTYPNLMSMEAVAGGEQYNNGPEMTTKGAGHNATLPFTRNVIGPMDYTPVTFTNSQHPHTTTFAHELALSVIFESGIQHMADRPAGYDNLPDAPKAFLRVVPASWDEVKFVDGYPGQRVIIARRKGTTWYLAGINGTDKKEKLKVPVTFLDASKNYKLTLIADGEYDSAFDTKYSTADRKNVLEINWLPRGGFAGMLQEEK